MTNSNLPSSGYGSQQWVRLRIKRLKRVQRGLLWQGACLRAQNFYLKCLVWIKFGYWPKF